MPVLARIRERFAKEKPLKGLRMSACLHVTAETANLARTLQAGGADLVLIASNPLSHPGRRRRQPGAGLRHRRLRHPAARTTTPTTSTSSPPWSIEPHVTMDDGADLVSRHDLHRPRPARRRARRRSATGPRSSSPAERKALFASVIGSMEETTTGVIRLRAMEKDGVLQVPGHRRQRRRDQALLRQPLRHRPEHDRRHHPRDQHAAGRPQDRRLRLRLVRQGRGAAGPRPGRATSSSPRSIRSGPWRRRWTASRSCRWPRPPPIGDMFITVTGNIARHPPRALRRR